MNLLNTPLLAATLTLLAWSAEGRSFTNLAGVKIEAEIVSKQGDQVRIKRADGREFTLQVNSLSPADQEYIKTWQPPTTPGKPGAPAAPVSADPRVKPGAVVALEFPDLAKDRAGNTATCNVRIPEDYDPAKPVPLLVWLGGGNGSNQPGGGFALVDKAHWAVAALPYPSGTTPQGTTLDDQKNFTVIFNYQKTMLEELVKLLPNLDPKIRVVAGFSNGAHTIGTNIMRGEKEFTELFNAYILIEGGCNAPKAKKKMRGKYAYLAWDDPRSTPFMLQGAAGAAKAAGMTTTEHRMPNSGHAFPDTEKALVKEWIEKTVVPGLNAPPKKQGRPYATFIVVGATETAGNNPFDLRHGTTFSTEQTFKYALGEPPGGMTLGGLYSIDRQHIDLTQDARLFFASAIAGQTLTTNKDARAICWDGYQYLQDDEKKGWGLFGRLGFSDGTHDPASGSKHGVMAAAGVNRAGKPIKP